LERLAAIYINLIVRRSRRPPLFGYRYEFDGSFRRQTPDGRLIPIPAERAARDIEPDWRDHWERVAALLADNAAVPAGSRNPG
jgi:hypothetical protein